MREILFRGKRKDNGIWTGGYLFCIWEKSYLCWGTTNNVPNMNEIIPETVCQFTGLTDKNGVRIFEGDILRVTDEHKEYITFVRCVDNTLCVDIFVDNTGDLELDYEYTAIGFAEDFWKNQSCKVEIIGNIFDNPELMEVKQNG